MELQNKNRQWHNVRKGTALLSKIVVLGKKRGVRGKSKNQGKVPISFQGFSSTFFSIEESPGKEVGETSTHGTNTNQYRSQGLGTRLGTHDCSQVLPPLHQQLSVPFYTLLLEKKRKNSNNSTTMESTEFTIAFFLSRLLTSLLRRTLAVDCVTKHVEHRRTGRGGWEQKIVLFGQN